jgi:hypothetical protein
MSDKRKTAVEYLKNNLPSLFQDDQSGFYTTLFERAKALEREQIEEAYNQSDIDGSGKSYGHGKLYYNETYGE